MCDASNNYADASGATVTDNARDCVCASTYYLKADNSCATSCDANDYK